MEEELISLVHIVAADLEVRAEAVRLLSSHGLATRVYLGGAEFLKEGRLDEGCILLDLELPGISGEAVQAELARRGAELPVIVLTAAGHHAAAVQALRAGAADSLERPLREEDLLPAIDRALASYGAAGDRRKIRMAAARRLDLLSPRERQILQGLLAGLSNKAIARRLGLSPRTVEMHRANMMADLGTDSLPEALRLAIDAELPPLRAEGLDEAAPVSRAPVARPARAQAARRDYEEKLRLVLEASSDGAWEWTIPTNELTVSARLLERFGYRPEDAPDRFDLLANFIHPDDWPGFRNELDAHLEGRSESFVCEFRVRRGDGSWAWIMDSGSIVDRDPATGAALRMAGSISDITPRKQSEEKARESAELLELALWGAGAGVWDFDVATRMIRLSARSRVLHGLAPEGPELVSEEEWAEAVHPDDIAGAREALARAVATGERCSARFRTRTREGGWRWLVALGKAVEAGDGAPRRVVGLNQEIAGAPGLGDGSGFALRSAGSST